MLYGSTLFVDDCYASGGLGIGAELPAMCHETGYHLLLIWVRFMPNQQKAGVFALLFEFMKKNDYLCDMKESKGRIRIDDHWYSTRSPRIRETKFVGSA